MKTKILAISLAAAMSSSAAIIVPGANGTDGALNITADTEIDLSQAITAAWDSNNTANMGKGVYDATKWAVVFKYSSVNVAVGATLTFKNHGSRAPVVWLVSGNVTIAGTVKLDGQNSITTGAARLAEPGPGGFRGGNTSGTVGTGSGPGFGPGGAQIVHNQRNLGNASYGSLAPTGSSNIYGNPSIIPLLGGSGGSGAGGDQGYGLNEQDGGAGGGGAILVASANGITINGLISARGGDDSNRVWPYTTGSGSGGGIRLLSDSLTGAGEISAIGGVALKGGNGRIRLERVSNNTSMAVVPAPSVVDLSAGASALLWPPTGAPEVKIISLGGQPAPADPKSGFGTSGADVSIPTATTTPAVIETTNVEQASQVKVRITPRDTYDFTEVNATYDSTVSASPLVIRWNATLPTNLGYSAVQVKVIRP